MLSSEIQGKEVIGSMGHKLGVVRGVSFDEKEWKVLALEVQLEKNIAEEHRLRHRFKKTRVLLNIEHVQAVGDKVLLTGSHEDLLKLIASSPSVGPQEAEPEGQPSGGEASVTTRSAVST
ncbi:MAG: PRC-barrel domain-containing protein [archaeon]|jgi:sporulation protein YlmC with PRC-barrel domain|nr:PRC-barrel domain-containing protein [archaeon]